MSMCIHRVIQELEEGANYKLPNDIKEYLISNSTEFEISSVLKGNPECYLGLFYEKALNPNSKIIQNGDTLSFEEVEGTETVETTEIVEATEAE